MPLANSCSWTMRAISSRASMPGRPVGCWLIYSPPCNVRKNAAPLARSSALMGASKLWRSGRRGIRASRSLGSGHFSKLPMRSLKPAAIREQSTCSMVTCLPMRKSSHSPAVMTMVSTPGAPSRPSPMRVARPLPICCRSQLSPAHWPSCWMAWALRPLGCEG